jgi:hypothetical protein
MVSWIFENRRQKQYLRLSGGCFWPPTYIGAGLPYVNSKIFWALAYRGAIRKTLYVYTIRKEEGEMKERGRKKDEGRMAREGRKEEWW